MFSTNRFIYFQLLVSGKNYVIIRRPSCSKCFERFTKRRLAIVGPDTSTLGDASFSVSFVQKLNDAMAEIPTAAQLQGKRKTQHRKAYERPAGLRPSY